MNYVELIDRLDKLVFIIIQHDTDSKILDHVMPVLRNPLTWIPLYCFLFYFIVTRLREMIIPFILLTIATVCVNDMLSSWVIKPWVERPRPCYDEDIKPFLRAVIECGGRFSFPSSHAANHVGLATFWYLSLKQVTGRRWYWLFVWALLIGYAQIYVGKHYPLDIAAGSLMGILTGYLFAALFRQWPLLTKSFVSFRKADSL
jgi:membrane-associated phospholipid phosphatase